MSASSEHAALTEADVDLVSGGETEGGCVDPDSGRTKSVREIYEEMIQARGG